MKAMFPLAVLFIISFRAFPASLVGDAQTVANVTVNGAACTITSSQLPYDPAGHGKALILTSSGAANFLGVINTANAGSYTFTPCPGPASGNYNFYWGTDNTQTIRGLLPNVSLPAVSSPNLGYLITQTITLTANTVFSGNILTPPMLLGDPGNNALLLNTGASGAQISGVNFNNLHANFNSDTSFFGIECRPCNNTSIHDNQFTGGNVGVYFDSPGAQYTTISNNLFNGLIAGGIGGSVSGSSGITDLTIQNNTISGTQYNLVVNGPGHAINMEDTGNLVIAGNTITDTAVAAGASCIQAAYAKNSPVVSNVQITNNTCSTTQASSSVDCILLSAPGGNALSNVLIQGNLCTGAPSGGYLDGLVLNFAPKSSPASPQLSGIRIAGNTFENVRERGVDIDGSPINPVDVVAQDITVSGNSILGIGTISATTPDNSSAGILLYRVGGVTVEQNTVAFFGDDGIQAAGTVGCRIVGNTIWDNSQLQKGVYAGVRLLNYNSTFTSSSNEVSSNALYDDGAGMQGYGLEIQSGANNAEAGNNAYGNTTAQIQIASGSGPTSCATGSIWADNNYIYACTSQGVVKKVAIQ